MRLQLILVTLIVMASLQLIWAEEKQEGRQCCETGSIENLILYISGRLLNNKNTATLSAAAVGLGIGVVGSLLVGKVIEDRGCKDDPLGFIPDILGT